MYATRSRQAAMAIISELTRTAVPTAPTTTPRAPQVTATTTNESVADSAQLQMVEEHSNRGSAMSMEAEIVGEANGAGDAVARTEVEAETVAAVEANVHAPAQITPDDNDENNNNRNSRNHNNNIIRPTVEDVLLLYNHDNSNQSSRSNIGRQGLPLSNGSIYSGLGAHASPGMLNLCNGAVGLGNVPSPPVTPPTVPATNDGALVVCHHSVSTSRVFQITDEHPSVNHLDTQARHAHRQRSRQRGLRAEKHRMRRSLKTMNKFLRKTVYTLRRIKSLIMQQVQITRALNASNPLIM